MKLYRFEIGSDDGDEEIMKYKELVGEFPSDADAHDYIRHQYSPTNIMLKTVEPFAHFNALVAFVCDADEPIDEILWLTEPC